MFSKLFLEALERHFEGFYCYEITFFIEATFFIERTFGNARAEALTQNRFITIGALREQQLLNHLVMGAGTILLLPRPTLLFGK